MSRSNFSPSGLDIGNNTTNMAYLYGVSDFFSVMFEDTSKVNLLLESSTEVASAAYSKFLQMTSTISLEDIQTTLNQTLKLVTIKSTDKIVGQVNLYKLSDSVLSSRYIANRPLLPTTLMEQDVDYRLEKTADGEFRIRFSRDISDAGFSTRLLKDEVTKEYALWFVDSNIDEKWISDNYADLVGVSPEISTDVFKSFVYGLYYIYLNGPTLELLRKGLNLCLGVPLARNNETVLDVRKYLETDQYIVVTDSNQYLIPYGLAPTIVEGDTLQVGDELAQWVEIKDYIQDGDWWINLKIPPKLIPSLPDGQVNRYATKGSHFDYLMRTYLKKHTFLVNVKVTDFKNNQAFQQLSDIINKAKPSYTESVYIWTVPNTEEFKVNDDRFGQTRNYFKNECVIYDIYQFYRNNVTSPVNRGDPMFLRYHVPNNVSQLLGTDAYINGSSIQFNMGNSTGFVNSISQYRANTPVEKSWLRTVRDRGTETMTTPRSRISFTRNIFSTGELSSTTAGIPVHSFNKMGRIPTGMRILPLYITTQGDLASKCDSIGIHTPSIKEWYFEIFNPLSVSESVNSLAVNEMAQFPDTSLLLQNFNTFTKRGLEINYLSNLMPQLAYASTTIGPSDLSINDFLVGIRIHDDVIGIYLVTSNNFVPSSYIVVQDNDPLDITFNTNPTRGMGITSSSYYVTRGRRNLDYNISMSEINGQSINDATSGDENILNNGFSDSMNLASVSITRNSFALVHKMELR